MVEGADFRLNVTASLGVAEKLPHMKGIDDLLKAADVALYRAKDEGRNRVIVAPPRTDASTLEPETDSGDEASADPGDA